MKTDFDLIAQDPDFIDATNVSGSTWPTGNLGSAFSATTRTFHFQHMPETIVFARFLVIWWPTQYSIARLIHMDDGPTNITHMTAVDNTGTGGTAAVDSIDITSVLETLRAAGVAKHLGVQAAAAVPNTTKIGAVRLEIYT